MKLLINLTMKEAQPIGELGKEIFPVVVVGKREFCANHLDGARKRGPNGTEHARLAAMPHS